LKFDIIDLKLIKSLLTAVVLWLLVSRVEWQRIRRRGRTRSDARSHRDTIHSWRY